MLPIRREADHRSEMVSQMLFGETAAMLDKKKAWLRIRMDYDHYEGWVEENTLTDCDNEKTNQLKVINVPLVIAESDHSRLYLPAGSEVPLSVHNNRFSLAGQEYRLSGSNIPNTKPTSFLETARLFLNAPYLWGGRTVFGIDCSGLIQIACKIHGIKLPRDAAEQSGIGRIIDTFAASKKGDLMFFKNEKAKVVHVGFYLGDGAILHASKKVRIDAVNERGIYNHDLKMYTHSMHSIRRLPVA